MRRELAQQQAVRDVPIRLVLAFAYLTNRWLAVLADMGTSLLVTASALLLAAGTSGWARPVMIVRGPASSER